MLLDIVKADEKMLEEGLKDFEKEDLVNLVLGLKKEIAKDYDSFECNVQNIPFERIRRITGYLVGTVDRFNNGKRAEEHDRVKHDVCR